MKKKNTIQCLYDAVPFILPFVVFFIYTPVRIVNDNSTLFSFPIGYVFLAEIVFVCITLFVTAIAFYFIPERIRKCLVWISTTLAICLLINGETQNNMAGILQGYTRFWPDYRWDTVINLFLWCLSVFLCIVAAKKYGQTVVTRILRWISTIGIVCLITVSGIMVGNTPEPNMKSYATTNGIETVSTDNNIYVFILDCMDGDYVDQIHSSDPQFFDEMTGFTEYTNATSVYANTVASMTSMLSSDYEDVYQMPFDEYYNVAWDNECFFCGLTHKNYAINYYDDLNTIFGNSHIPDTYFSNFTSDRVKPQYSYTQTIEKMLVLSVFRDFPMIFQPFFEHSSTDVNSAIVIDSGEIDPFGFYSGSTYLRGVDEIQTENTKQFKLFHIDGAHPPYTYDEDGHYRPAGVTPAQEAKGNLLSVMNYLCVLKEYGVYDNSSIFIIADHGFWVDSSKALQKPTTIAFYYKPAGAKDTFKTEDSPVSLKNVVPTILKDAGVENYSDSRIPLDEIQGSPTENRKYYKNVTVSGGKTLLYEYEIIGNANQIENWVNTEVRKLSYE